MRTRYKILCGARAALALATGFAVGIHVPAVRAALGWKPLEAAAEPSAFCPFGYGTPSAAPALPPRTVTPTTPRPALGFTLDVTTRAEIEAWAITHGIRCTPQHGSMVLECVDVPAALVPATPLAATSVWFRFTGATLAGIQTVRRTDAVDSIVAAFAAVEVTMTAAVGSPSKRQGEADAATLGRGTLRQAMVEYRAPAYRAVVRATNMGDGYVLTESYAN